MPTAPLSEVRLHYAEAGEGPLVILLHGFPDTHHLWRRQMDDLSKDFRVVAPDLRGYGESDRPSGVFPYRTSRVAEDIAELIAHLGQENAFVAGHDWGGATAWTLAALFPHRVKRLAVLNCPHSGALRWHLRHNFQQLKRSWYVLFFQIPWLPEKLLGRDLRSTLWRMYKRGVVNRASVTEDHVEQSLRGLHLTPALNYYRAALRHPTKLPPIEAPTLLLWGKKDFALGPETAESSRKYVTGEFSLEFFEDAGHWVSIDKPQEVSARLAQFFRPA